MFDYKRIFPKILFLILICGATLLPVLFFKNSNLNVSNNDEIAIGTMEYSDEYKQYLIDLENGDIEKYGGYIPEACTTDYTLPDLKLSKGTLASSYNPIPLNLVTPAKNQGANGSCWAFATLGALEQYYLYKDGVTYDFSEEDMRFIFSNDTNAKALNYGYYNIAPNSSGNVWRSTAYLSNWLGAVDETSVPYTIGTTWNEDIGNAYLSSLVTDTAIVPYSDTLDMDIVKNYILEYGGVQTSTYYSGTYFEDFSCSYYYNGATASNHAILLVGWNDNYDKTYFVEGTQPTNNGAWLVKNSYGTSYGYDGFYWLSYEDAVLNRVGTLFSTITGAIEPTTNKKMLTNDYLGETTNYTFGSNTSMTIGNIFDVSDLTYNTISDVMFLAAGPSNYTIRIAKSTTGTPNLSGTIVATGTVTTKGYVTATLDTPFVLTSTGKYAIVITLSEAVGGIHLAVETDTSTINANVSFGQSFIYSSSWYDVSNGGYSGLTAAGGGNLVANFIIRAILYSEDANFEIDTAVIDGGLAESNEISLEYTIDNSLNTRIPTDEGGISYKWQTSTTNLESGTWTDISGQSDSTLIVQNSYGGKYVRGVVICDGSGNVESSSLSSNILGVLEGTPLTENEIVSFSMAINSSSASVPATLYTDDPTYGNSITSTYYNNDATVLLDTVYEISEGASLVVYSTYSSGTYSGVISSTSVTTTKSVQKIIYAVVTAENGDVRAYTITINQLPIIVVTSVTILTDTAPTELLHDESYSFNATVLPANAPNKNIVWSVTGDATITNAGVLTVNSDAENSSIITVTATAESDNTISDSWQITVTDTSVTSVTISNNDLPSTLASGESYSFTASILPSYAINNNIVWSVSGNATITNAGVLKVNEIAQNGDVITVTATSEENATLYDTHSFTVSSYAITANNYTLLGMTGDIYNEVQWYLSQVILTPIFPTNYTIAVVINNGVSLTASGGVFSIFGQGENNITLYFKNSSDICTDNLQFSIYIDSETNVPTPEIYVPYSATESHTYTSLITNIIYTDLLTFSALPTPNKINFNYTVAAPVSAIKGYEFALKNSTQDVSDITYTYISVADLSTLYTILAQKITVRIGTQNYLQFKGNIYLRAVSGAGMKSASICTNGIIIDNAQPFAPIIYTLAGGTVYTADTYTKEDISITLSSDDSISGVSKYRYRYRDVNSAQFSSWSDVTTGLATLKNRIDVTVDCERVYQMQAVSKSGIVGTDNISQIIVKRDTVSPTISYVSGNPTDWVHSADINFEYSVGKCGLNTLIVQKGTQSQLLESTATSFTVNENGNYTITVEDNLNRSQMFEIEITFIEDSLYTIYEFIDVLDTLPATTVEADRAYIVELYDIYNNYSLAKKQAITNYGKLGAAIQALSTTTERIDATTGATVDAEDLPFNVVLEVDNIESNTTDFAIVKARDSEKNLLSLYDINLTQSGSDYEFENVTIKLPVPENQPNNSTYSVIHITDTGTIEYIECSVENGYVLFSASSSGAYGIMSESNINNTFIIILIVLGSMALITFAVLFIIKNVKIRKFHKLYKQEKLNTKNEEKKRNLMKMSEKFNPDKAAEGEAALKIKVQANSQNEIPEKTVKPITNIAQTTDNTKPVGSVFGIKNSTSAEIKPAIVAKPIEVATSNTKPTTTVIKQTTKTSGTAAKSTSMKKRKSSKPKPITKPFKLNPTDDIKKASSNKIPPPQKNNVTKPMASKKVLTLSKNKK